MKNINIFFLIITVASLSSARAGLDEATFFAGVSLGKTQAAIDAYYKPYRKTIAEMWHSGALPGEHDFDLRTSMAEQQRRIYFSVRDSDKQVVSVKYCKFSNYLHPVVQSFSPEEVARLTAANKLSSDKLYSHSDVYDGDAELEFASETEHAKQAENN
jgi:hypothetical protein